MKSQSSQTSLTQAFTHDHVIFPGFIIAVLLTLTQWFIIAIYIWQLPPEVPLFYSFPVGIDQLANKYWLLLIPFISTFSLIIWWLLFYFSRHINRVFHQTTAWFTALVALLGAISLLHIIILIY